MTSAFKKSNLYVCTCLPLIEVTSFQLFPDGATRQTLVASETKTGFCYTSSLQSSSQNGPNFLSNFQVFSFEQLLDLKPDG